MASPPSRHATGDWTSWPLLDDEHRRLVADLDGWIAVHAEPHADSPGGTGQPARLLYERLAADDWFTRAAITGLPTRSGLMNACLIRDCLAYSSGIADVSFSEPWLASLPIQLAGDDATRPYLDAHLAGRCLLAFALSEPGAGSDAAALTTTATRDGDHYVIDGRKTWTSNAGLADAYVLFARTEDVPGPRGISAFVVDAASPGIVLEERLQVLPPHTVGTLGFTGCPVHASNMLGEPGTGFSIAMEALDLFRPTVAAATVGFARRALHEALDRALIRNTFGTSISQHQLVQGKLATMAADLDAAALLVLRAGWQHDSTTDRISQAASIAKLFATEAAQRIVDDAVQIFGGLGVTRGVTVERLYREVRAFRLFDGSTEVQKLIIAKNALAVARECAGAPVSATG